MAETLTANYGWTKPDPGASTNTWGATLNADLDKIDAQVFLNQQGLAPVGAMALWPTNTPPANWLISNGQSLATTGTYAALFAIIGYTFGGSGANFNLPNLSSRFPLGAGGSVAVAAVGGAASVTLATANLPAHAHSITDVAHNHGVNQSPHQHPDSSHTHGASGSQDPHSHTVGITQNQTYFGPNFGQNVVQDGGQTGTSTAQPNVYVSVAASGANIGAADANISLNASGTGLSTTNNTGSGQAVATMPPFIGINFIIKYR